VGGTSLSRLNRPDPCYLNQDEFAKPRFRSLCLSSDVGRPAKKASSTLDAPRKKQISFRSAPCHSGSQTRLPQRVRCRSLAFTPVADLITWTKEISEINRAKKQKKHHMCSKLAQAQPTGQLKCKIEKSKKQHRRSEEEKRTRIGSFIRRK